jgi:tetratricopeptide (TPR) repeat protein
VAKALDIEPWISSAPADVGAVQAFIQGTDYAYRGMPGGREYYERAIQLDPRFIAPRVWLVSSLVTAGDTTEAHSQIQVLQSLKAGATPFEQAMIGWSEAVVAGDLQAKANHLRVALSYSPRNNVLLYQLGDVLAALGRFEEAAEPLRLALESRWRFVPLYALWGQVAILTGRLEGLRETLEGARSFTPQRPLLAGLLEALDLYEGDVRAAERDGAWFRSQPGGAQTSRTLRDLAPVYRALARGARERGYPERATVLSRRATDAESGRP